MGHLNIEAQISKVHGISSNNDEIFPTEDPPLDHVLRRK